MTVSFYLTRPKADSATAIFARLCYHGHQLKYFTSKKIHPKFWRTESQRAQKTDKFREYPEFNRRMDNFATDVKNAYRQWVNDHGGRHSLARYVESRFGPGGEGGDRRGRKDHHPLGLFDDVIRQSEAGLRLQPQSGKPYSWSTLQVYRNTLNRLIAYAAHRRRP